MRTDKNAKLYFSNGQDVMSTWDHGDFIDFAPEGKFITRFLKRLKAFRQFERLIKGE